MCNWGLKRDGLHFFFPGVFLNFIIIPNWHRTLLSVSSQNELQHFENIKYYSVTILKPIYPRLNSISVMLSRFLFLY